MRRAFLPGVIVGALLATALGYAIAVLPTTPTWALWQIKRALDESDLNRLRQMVDFPAVAGRAVAELGHSDPGDDSPGLDLKQIGLSLLSGGKLLTVFNDPDHPIRLGAGDFLAAWWGMREDGDQATLSVDANGRPVSLVLQRDDGTWRIVGITPLSALLRVKPAPDKTP